MIAETIMTRRMGFRATPMPRNFSAVTAITAKKRKTGRQLRKAQTSGDTCQEYRTSLPGSIS